MLSFGPTMMSRSGNVRRRFRHRAKFKGVSNFMISTCEFFGKNFAWNLNSLPDDRLDWKPAPTANSAFEVAQHAAASLRNMQLALEGQEYGVGSPPMPTTREEAQDMIIGAANAYADYLRGLTETPQGEVELPWGILARAQAVGMPVQDLVHHHGQIAYIQTLLGDTSDHFFEFEGG